MGQMLSRKKRKIRNWSQKAVTPRGHPTFFRPGTDIKNRGPGMPTRNLLPDRRIGRTSRIPIPKRVWVSREDPFLLGVQRFHSLVDWEDSDPITWNIGRNLFNLWNSEKPNLSSNFSCTKLDNETFLCLISGLSHILNGSVCLTVSDLCCVEFWSGKYKSQRMTCVSLLRYL